MFDSLDDSSMKMLISFLLFIYVLSLSLLGHFLDSIKSLNALILVVVCGTSIYLLSEIKPKKFNIKLLPDPISVQFERVEKSLYKEFSYVIVSVNNKELRFKTPQDIINRSFFKKEQDFKIVHKLVKGQRCSIKLIRDFGNIEEISTDTVCF